MPSTSELLRTRTPPKKPEVELLYTNAPKIYEGDIDEIPDLARQIDSLFRTRSKLIADKLARITRSELTKKDLESFREEFKNYRDKNKTNPGSKFINLIINRLSVALGETLHTDDRGLLTQLRLMDDPEFKKHQRSKILMKQLENQPHGQVVYASLASVIRCIAANMTLRATTEESSQ